MQNIYIHPNINKNSEIKNANKNPYIVLLKESLKIAGYNISEKKGRGILGLLKNRKAKIWIINWPESIVFKKYGKLQLLIYLFLLLYGRVLNKHIIWILHNKTHHSKKSRYSTLSTNITAFFTRTIITHCKEGVRYAKENYYKNAYFIPHPIYPNQIIPQSKEELYDILMWGEVSPRKKIAEFLEYCSTDDLLSSFRITICGKCNDVKYARKINEYVDKLNSIKFINRYHDDSEINAFLSKTKYILFTYNKESILSSGALTYSLAAMKPIFGPNTGAFVDLEDEGIVTTFNSFGDLKLKLKNPNFDLCSLRRYLSINTWDNFGKKFKFITDN
ncbi:hypothetical protein [uncultured Draconibacterium sp.]|uniref:hypothetical protein n=1 Tax=uncultured Draconibacterium sp. TaxID=1573823 RepID=UPI0025F5799F|nr:hypothetical protein [uncultured Draconibacterium sp.]